MADTNETQLLNDLLSAIAREDARLDAAHLEARVMDTVGADVTVRLKPDTTYFGVTGFTHWALAAVVAAAVLVPTVFWQLPVEKAVVSETEVAVPAEGPAIRGRSLDARELWRDPPKPWQRREAGHYVLPRASRYAKPSVTQSPSIAQSPIAQSRDEFVPLMPLTEQERTGPFQIVRVQMPRASLGALRSPLEHPNDLVEADVLLGEDGTARAIRVSTSGSVYPWRSR